MLVSGLFVYPIKACGGVAVSSHAVATRGFLRDRRYMLVDRTGTFVTQREVTRLALVNVAFQDERRLRVTAPGASALVVEPPSSGERVPVRVWEDHGAALRLAEGSRWFSDFLGDHVSLVYMPDTERRPVNPSRARADDIVSYADAYPFLLISEASLSDLNARLESPVSMWRFRPNIVISGCKPYAEDHFSRLSVGSVAFRAAKRCERCSVTTVDPDTGKRGKEPLRTLAAYRVDDGKVWFGMNLIHDASGVIAVGDRVTLG